MWMVCSSPWPHSQPALQALPAHPAEAILERQREGIAIAKKTGKYTNVGRRPILSDEQMNEIRAKLQNGVKIAALAREFGVSRQTIYSWLM